MVDRNEVIKMTKLARHNDKYFKTDCEADEYFRLDYIYKKNSYTRWCVFVGCLILIIFKYLNMFFVEDVDVFLLNPRKEIIGCSLFIICTMLIYTAIGTVRGNKDYSAYENRKNEYRSALSKLGGNDLNHGKSTKGKKAANKTVRKKRT